ncbi:MAG TPA: TlpA disulfide reductase family protein [Thiobacillus sp.]|nr:TlpA disulfide reductase family protein [Thiobacillus sp.]
MKLRKHVAGAALALCCAFGAGAHAADLPPLSHSLNVQTPKPAPALKFKDIDGKTLDLAQLKGKVVLINFWATWCPPCRREMPSMERLSQAFKGKPFVVLAVNVGEDADTIEAFTSQLDAVPTFPILLDTRSQGMRAWKVAGLPTTFLVDQQGRIVASAIGGREFDHPEIVETIRGSLGK